MVRPDAEPLEARAENLLLGFLQVFDAKAQKGLFSRKEGRKLTEDEVGAMRDKVKRKFYELLKFSPDTQLYYADTFESGPDSPIGQIAYGSINGDVRDEFRKFLITALRELNKS